MSNNYFDRRAGKSYYYNSIKGFLSDNPNEVLGILTKFATDYGFDTSKEQSDARQNQILELQLKLRSAGCSGDIIFEYDIVRLGKRIDVVLLIKHMVFSLEFKNGAKTYLAKDKEQAEDYALNLKYFHKESENLYVCPILVATEANDYNNKVETYEDRQVYLQCANKTNLMDCIKKVYEKYGDEEEINFQKWHDSPYCPTPTIIEAAVTAYKEHTVESIANSDAGQEGIEACENEVSKIITYAKSNNKKCLCFVTGVPGAGKTLVGLDLAAKNLAEDNKPNCVYLSGNQPLVDVISEALVRNTVERQSTKKKKLSQREKSKIKEEIQAFIQHAYRFRNSCIKIEQKEYPHNLPPENIIIFDEGQRCWNREKLSNWTKSHLNQTLEVSEPNYFISIMDRRRDWSVIICLAGLGQDINDGEVGINERFRSAIEDYDDREIFYSPKIFDVSQENSIDKEMILSSPRTHQIEKLHLLTSVRSFRAEKLSDFVDCLLLNKVAEAKKLYNELKNAYPIHITRDLKKAKQHIREKVRGSQRCGVIASSSAQRLKPEGIFVLNKIDEKNWFLSSKDDLRSSNAMEIVASEFKIQGLELDYTVVCWDADLRRENNSWGFYRFRGTKWEKRSKPEMQRYLLNAYRVLLTRARQALVIFVPFGDETGYDKTRNTYFYDGIYDYLHKQIGIEEL